MNRLLYAVLICTGLLFAKNVAANNYRLNEAASNHLISYALDGSSNSTHYQKPVEIGRAHV